MPDPIFAEPDSRLEALLRWREDLIATGAVSAQSFKEAHIRLVLRSGRTEAEQLREMLPGAVAEHAEEMARVLGQATGERTPGHGLARLVKDAGRPSAPEQPHDGRAGDEAPQSGYAPYRFAPTPDDVATLSFRRVAAGGDEGAPVLEVSWPRLAVPDGHCVVYRLVSTETDRGHSPDNGHLVAATFGTSTHDARQINGARRHLQVWAQHGLTQAEAVAAQPVLHAHGVVVGTLRDAEVREDCGSVIGQWHVPDGVSAVHVYRVPHALADRAGPAFRILAGRSNLTGFVDPDAQRGQRYLYQLRCEVEVDGVVRLSDYVQHDVRVSAVLEPVTDVELAQQPDGSFELSWTPPPFGTVQLYRMPEAPNADAMHTDLPEEALDQVGLTRPALLTHPVAARPGSRERERSNETAVVMRGVSWPQGWSRAYFVPVTVLDGRARLGRPASAVRTGAIHDVSLMEYCSKQVLTFDWPHGAAAVRVFVGPRGHDPRRGLTGRSHEISLAEYERNGGMHFVDDLPHRGCSLHLLPVAYAAGRPVLGTPASVDYAGLLKVWYDVRFVVDAAGLPLTCAVRVRSEHDAAGSPPFVLVHNPDRIPLSSDDGRSVDMFRLDAAGNTASGRVKTFQWSSLSAGVGGETWGGDVRGLRGWVRLFADLPPDRLRRFALLDPHVGLLRLPTGGRG